MTHPVPELEVEIFNDEDLLFKNVRTAYNHFWTPGNFQGKETGFETLLLVPKANEDACRMIKYYLSEIAKHNGVKINKPGLTCVRDADVEQKESEDEKLSLIHI